MGVYEGRRWAGTGTAARVRADPLAHDGSLVALVKRTFRETRAQSLVLPVSEQGLFPAREAASRLAM